MAVAGTFAGTVLPDAFIGVPYLAGLPVNFAASNTPSSISFSGLPPGLTIAPSGVVVSGTVQVTASTGSQVDGSYAGAYSMTAVAGATLSSALTINVHYLTADQDLSVTAQAAIRAGEAIDSTGGEDVGATSGWTADFPTSPTVPTDIG